MNFGILWMNIAIVLKPIYMKFVHGIALIIKAHISLVDLYKMLAASPQAQICRPNIKMKWSSLNFKKERNAHLMKW